MNKATVVYRRVSTDRQTTASQDHAIGEFLRMNKREGVLTLEDKLTGKTMSRPGFNELRTLVERGQVQELIFWRLDRLGRSLIGICEFLDLCVRKNIKLTSIKDNIDYTTTHGKAITQMMAVFAELQRELISENTKAGIAAAREKNKDNPNWKLGGSKHKGWISRKLRNLSPSVLAMRAEKQSIEYISKELHISERSVRKIIRANGQFDKSKIR